MNCKRFLMLLMIIVAALTANASRRGDKIIKVGSYPTNDPK